MPQGGIIGKANKTSFGKGKITAITSTGNYTTQPGTRVVHSIVVAGGGGGGGGGAGGSGGMILISARYISNSGTIRASAGNGANGQAGLGN